MCVKGLWGIRLLMVRQGTAREFFYFLFPLNKPKCSRSCGCLGAQRYKWVPETNLDKLPNEDPWWQPAYRFSQFNKVSFQNILRPYSLRKSCPCEFHFCPMLSISLLAQELCLTLVMVNYWGSAGLQEKCKQQQRVRARTGAKEAGPANNFRSFPFLQHGCPGSP